MGRRGGKYNRHRLKSHTRGDDRHDKGRATTNKAARLQAQHGAALSGRGQVAKRRRERDAGETA